MEGEDDLILMGMVKDVTGRFTERYMAGMLGVIQGINIDGDGRRMGPDQRSSHRSDGGLLQARRRQLALLLNASFYRLVGWIVLNLAADVVRLPGRLVPTALHPRYRGLPSRLRAMRAAPSSACVSCAGRTWGSTSGSSWN